MIAIKRCVLTCVLIAALLGPASLAGCVGMPKVPNPQFTQRHYTYSVLLAPERLSKSPQLELGLSLLRMEYPADQAEALHQTLYGQIGLEAYKDYIVGEQRKNYRSRAGDLPPADGAGTASYNWRYTERFNIKQVFERGIVIERELETYFGGANSGKNTKYYNIEIDVEGFRYVTFDDLFDDYQDDQRLRDIVYDKLREYSDLEKNQPLARGIYFTNEPELTFNFFISEKGLVLHWDPAQIAPRTHGSIQITLPWYSISALMMYEGIETLANKFNIEIF